MDGIRLCVQTYHPIDVGNYPGPIHCTACPEGTPCVTAMFERVPGTTMTEDERNPQASSGPSGPSGEGA